MWLMFPEFDRMLERRLGMPLPWTPVRDGVSWATQFAESALASRARWVETAGAYVLELDVPGVKHGDVQIEAHEGVLRVAGKRSLNVPEGYQARLAERESLSFERRFRLPKRVDLATTAAELRSGVLRITLSKLPEAKPKVITVQ